MSQREEFRGGAVAPLLERILRFWWLTLLLQVLAVVLLGAFGEATYAVVLITEMALATLWLNPRLHLVEATLAQLSKDTLFSPWMLLDTGQRVPRGIAALQISGRGATARSPVRPNTDMLLLVEPHRWGIRTWCRVERRFGPVGSKAVGEWIVLGGRGFATRVLNRLAMDISEVRGGDIFLQRQGLCGLEVTSLGRPSRAGMRAAALSIEAFDAAVHLGGESDVPEVVVARSLPRSLTSSLHRDPNLLLDPWSTSTQIVDSLRHAELQSGATPERGQVLHATKASIEGFAGGPEDGISTVDRFRDSVTQLRYEVEKRTAREREHARRRDQEFRQGKPSVAGCLVMLLMPLGLVALALFAAAVTEGTPGRSTLGVTYFSSLALWFVPGVLVWLRSRVALRRVGPRRTDLPPAFAEMASWTATIGLWIRAEVEAGTPPTPALIRCAEWVARHEGAPGHNAGYRGGAAAGKVTTTG